MIKKLLKSTFIITIISVAVIGFVIPSAFGEDYNLYFDDFGIFSINYPSDWNVESGDDGSVIFVDGKIDGWYNVIQVFYYEDIFYNEFTTNEIKKDIEISEEELCYSSSFELDGFICYNFQFHYHFFQNYFPFDFPSRRSI